MTNHTVSCRQTQTVEDAASLMSNNGFSVVPIIDESEKLVGIVTESDFVGKEVDVPHALASLKRLLGETYHHENIEAIYSRGKKKQLLNVMTKNPISITPETTLSQVVQIMTKKKVKRLPVIENEKIVGMVTPKDLLLAFSRLD